ncbi:MAG: hypothetical protein V4640_09990 [Verrucomicrobiota bacterium]
MKVFPRILFALAAVTLLGYLLTRTPRRPVTRLSEKTRLDHEAIVQKNAADPDTTLVRSLLAENLASRTFSFATVASACSGKKVLPLDQSPAHLRAIAALGKALDATLAELNRPDSPVRQLRRINEASRLFENAIHRHLQKIPGIACDVPPTRSGARQRSGYPDLRITDNASGTVFYLDPKLVAAGSETSSFRSFYFEPKDATLKITDDAVHLLVGISHDGKDGAWTFTRWRLVDLSTLRVRLKAEFQASNGDLYR